MSSHKKLRRKLHDKAEKRLAVIKRYRRKEFKSTWRDEWKVFPIYRETLVRDITANSAGLMSSWASRLVRGECSRKFPLYLVWDVLEHAPVGLYETLELMQFCTEHRGKLWTVYRFTMFVRAAQRKGMFSAIEAVADNHYSEDAKHVPLHRIVEMWIDYGMRGKYTRSVAESAECLAARHLLSELEEA